MTQTHLNPLRHLSVFSPDEFGKKRIDVIGAGATGSRIVLSLAKLGIENIHVWDFDVVESHNVANQVYRLTDIGKKKVGALAEIVKESTGITITVHSERVDGTQKLGPIVFLLTDTMSSRKEIWEKALRLHLDCELMIETRMGADSGRIYTVIPSQMSHVKAWESTLYADNDAEVSACGAVTSVGPTAEIISGMAVWQFMRWFSIEQGKADELEHEILLSLRSTLSVTRKF